jgi:hypothetical protein
MTQGEPENTTVKINNLEKRIQVFEDIEAIKILHRNYVYWLCNLQWDEMLGCFTEDALMDIAGDRLRNGKADIADFFQTVLAKMVTRKDGHMVGQPVISVEGTKAHGYWILFLFFSEPAMRWLQGRQEVEYEKINGQWLISNMKFINPWPGEANGSE